MTPFLFVGNFKMNPIAREDVLGYLKVLDREMNEKELLMTQGVLCPSFVHLAFFDVLPRGFTLGAQHGFPEKNGAFTGEVSFAMLKSMGVEFVIIGHSERRQFFGESNEAVRIRTDSALKYLLRPIVCIGETEAEYKAGSREKVVLEQVKSVLTGLSKMQAEKIIFAYEPRYAIGTGITPSKEEIIAIKDLLAHFFASELGEASAERMQILYGGSVKANNIQEVALDTGMNGVLVGKESLSPYEVVKMMDLAEKAQTLKATTL